MVAHRMPVAPEKLLQTFSLRQVANMVIAFEDATMGTESGVNTDESTVEPSAELATVRAPAA